MQIDTEIKEDIQKIKLKYFCKKSIGRTRSSSGEIDVAFVKRDRLKILGFFVNINYYRLNIVKTRIVVRIHEHPSGSSFGFIKLSSFCSLKRGENNINKRIRNTYSNSLRNRLIPSSGNYSFVTV